MPVHDGDEIHEAFGHRNEADVACPDLIGSFNIQSSQPVRINLVSLARLTRSGLWIDGPEPHFPHQALDALPIHSVASMLKLDAQPPTPVERPLQIEPIWTKILGALHIGPLSFLIHTRLVPRSGLIQ